MSGYQTSVYPVHRERRLKALMQGHNAIEHVLSRLSESQSFNEVMFRLKDYITDPLKDRLSFYGRSDKQQITGIFFPSSHLTLWACAASRVPHSVFDAVVFVSFWGFFFGSVCRLSLTIQIILFLSLHALLS